MIKFPLMMNTTNYDNIIALLLQETETSTLNASPIFLGIAGAPASGKSTLAALIKEDILKQAPNLTVNVLALDNFIYPNKYLETHSLMSKKGFPESFDSPLIINFFEKLFFNDQDFYLAPLYSQTIRDVHPTEKYRLPKSDLYIIEGVALFYDFSTGHASLHLHDFLNYSIYLDTPEDLIKKRAVNRFMAMYQEAKAATEPADYFKPLLGLKMEEVEQHAMMLWTTINKPLADTVLAPQGKNATYRLTDL